jgi:MFS family permease
MTLISRFLHRTPRSKPSLAWTLAIVSLGLFMTTLDNLVVTTAIPSIRRSLGASIQSLEWTVNAYTLTFAVLLLTGAALGDRFGRRRMFSIGLATFTVASAAAALSTSTDVLIAARAVQGFGAAIVLPLTLKLLSEAVPQVIARSLGSDQTPPGRPGNQHLKVRTRCQSSTKASCRPGT